MKIGDKVRCIDDQPETLFLKGYEKGKTYCVTGIRMAGLVSPTGEESPDEIQITASRGIFRGMGIWASVDRFQIVCKQWKYPFNILQKE